MNKDVFKKLGEIIKTQFTKAEQAVLDKHSVITAVKMKDIKTKDGAKIISYDGDVLAKDVAVMDNTNGTPAPLLDGTYPLIDGSSIVVLQGIITDVIPGAEVETPEQLAAKNAAAAAVVPAALKAMETKMSAQKAEYEKQIKDLAGVVITLKKQLDEVLEVSIGNGKVESTKIDLSTIPYDKMSNYQKLKFNEQR